MRRNWWDQTKRRCFGRVFWIHAFQRIQQFLRGAFMSNKTLLVIKALFAGTVKYSNTRLQPLISGGDLLCARGLHQYMQSLHPSLTIQQWLQELKDGENKGQKAKMLLSRVREQLGAIAVNMFSVPPLVAASDVPKLPIVPRLPPPISQHTDLHFPVHGPSNAVPYAYGPVTAASRAISNVRYAPFGRLHTVSYQYTPSIYVQPQNVTVFVALPLQLPVIGPNQRV